TVPGRLTSWIRGRPPGTPPRTEGSTFPRTREARATLRLTVVPEPGTNRPTAPRPAYAAGSKGGTTITLTRAAWAGAASAAKTASAASPFLKGSDSGLESGARCDEPQPRLPGAGEHDDGGAG